MRKAMLFIALLFPTAMCAQDNFWGNDRKPSIILFADGYLGKFDYTLAATGDIATTHDEHRLGGSIFFQSPIHRKADLLLRFGIGTTKTWFTPAAQNVTIGTYDAVGKMFDFGAGIKFYLK